MTRPRVTLPCFGIVKSWDRCCMHLVTSHRASLHAKPYTSVSLFSLRLCCVQNMLYLRSWCEDLGYGRG